MTWYAYDGGELLFTSKNLRALDERSDALFGHMLPIRTRFVEKGVRVGYLHSSIEADRLDLFDVRDHNMAPAYIRAQVPLYPSASMPRYMLNEDDRRRVLELMHGQDIHTRVGEHIALILGLHAMGLKHVEIARLLGTSKTYTARVISDPRAYMYEREADGKLVH